MKEKSLACAIAFAGVVAVAKPAAACVFLPVLEVDAAGPPDHLQTPEAIAAWEEEREREWEADQMRQARLQQEAEEAHWQQLAAQAEAAVEMPVEELVDDLVVTMVPPVLPQWVPQSDCGYEWSGVITANSGYIRDNAEYLAAMGLPHPADIGGRHTRANLNRHSRSARRCFREARALVAARITAEFSQAEIAHVWGGINRLGYIREDGRGWFGGMLVRRLLEFSGRTSGALRFAEESPVNGWSFTYPLEGDGYTATISSIVESKNRPENWSALQDFLTHDPDAARLVQTMSEALDGGTPEQCPDASAEMERYAAMLTLPDHEQGRLYWEERRRIQAAD